MRLRTLLLGTTSLCLVGLMPLAATAQDAGLTAAYEAYVSAQSGDDADAKAAAEAAFLAECQRVGAPDLNGCIAIATGATAPEAPVAEEPPPEEPPVVEPPAPEEPAVEEPAPEEPAVEQPPMEEPAVEPPVTDQPIEPTTVEQPPVTDEQPPAEEPVVEQPAPDVPAVSPAEDPALIAAYEAYVSAASGGDDAAKASAEAAFLAECNRVGIASLEECLAVMGGGVVATPPADQPQTEVPPATEPPATEQPPAPEGEMTPPATDQPIEETVPGIETPDAPIAPVLDSQKQPPAEPPADQPAAEQPPAPQPPMQPPVTDEDSQVGPPVTEEEIDQTVSEEGTRIEQLPLDRPPGVDFRPTSDDRYIINIGINVTIYTPYQDRDRIGRDAREVYYDELPNGRVRQTVIRDDGTQVITVWNRYGEIERRIKVRPDGTRVVLIYAREDRRDDWRDPGDDLPPFVLPIPVNDYVLYSEDADEDELVAFLDQPPLEQAQRVYSIDEVKRSARIRDTVRKVDIGDITFATDSAEVSRDQVGSLTRVAQAMARIIEDDPSEVFLIEGHTDAVGDDDYNLELSDQRAETIANLLTDLYNIPPENLTTQGYGEEYLKVLTEGPERANRRATVRRITPLVSADNS